MVAQKNSLARSKPLRIVANALIAVGIIAAAAIAYQVWGTNVTSAILADQERTALKREFSQPNNLVPSLVEPEASKSFGLVSIPALKLEDFPLVQGIEERDLAKGIGHYPGTAMPGGLGNFAIAGHRAGNGEPFAEFEKLKAGDTLAEVINTPHNGKNIGKVPLKIAVFYAGNTELKTTVLCP